MDVIDVLGGLIDIDKLWAFVRSGNNSLMSDVCAAAVAMVGLSFALKLAVAFVHERKLFTATELFPMALSLMVFVAVVSPVGYPLIGDIAVNVFNLTTGTAVAGYGGLDEVKEAVLGLFNMILLHEGDNVSFFNPHQGATVPVTLFSLFLNLMAAVLFVSLTIGPLYMLLCLVIGPLVIAFAFLFGKELIVRWIMLLFAATFIQLTLGLAVTVIFGTGGTLAAVEAFVEGTAATGGSLELAVSMMILSAVVLLAVPMIHGFIFGVPVFYVLPAVVCGATVIYDWGISFLSMCGFTVQRHKKAIGA